MELETRKLTTEEQLNHLIFEFHRIPVDYWWRKKYNIPFGSRQHREMNPIDMLIEYREEELIKEIQQQIEREEDEKEMRAIGIENNEVKMTQDEIDDEYENLDLSQFDK